MLNPVAMSIIRNVFTDARERAQAIGMWGATVGISMALGPVVGGLLVQSTGWPAVFWINIPVGLAAIALTMLFVPESKAPNPRSADVVGQLLVIAMLASLTYAIIEGQSSGWTSAEILSLFSIAAVALLALVGYERKRSQPLLELRFFKSVPFACASAIAVCAFAALGGFLFLNTLYLQEIRHLSALQAGVRTLPIAAMTLVFAPVSGRLIGHRGPRPGLLVGGLGIALGGAILTDLTIGTSLPTLLVAYLVFGIGFGMVNSPITNTAVSGMPRAQAGVAAAVASTSRQVGQSLGVAVTGSIAGAAAGGIGPGFAAATHPAWWLVLGCGAAITVLCAVATSRPAERSASRVAALLADEPAGAVAPAG
jgi:EmrB/QacA subfamily drug resistance transporter